MLEQLKHNGFTQKLELDLTLLEELRIESLALRDNLLKKGTDIAGKPIWDSLMLSTATDGQSIDENSVFIRFALQAKIVRLVTHFFGEVPYLSYVFLAHSKYSGQENQISQLWHRDYDDISVIKLFVYLTDVLDVEYGPFTLINKPSSRRISSFHSTHLKDEYIFSKISRESVFQMLYPATGAFLVNTSHCYHMGSRLSSGKTRLMYTACFITHPTIYPNTKNPCLIKGKTNPIIQMLLTP
ncbi:MAG: hypothetical protein F6J87_01420 [Spirulina sp. SIO3F2]|nr:hypothetical protein [Spirulina sp. SIO3F2]